MKLGFIKVAAGTPKVTVADCEANGRNPQNYSGNGKRAGKGYGISGALYYWLYLSGSFLAAHTS